MFRLNIFFQDQYPEIESSEIFKTREEAEIAAQAEITFEDGLGFEIEEEVTADNLIDDLGYSHEHFDPEDIPF